MIETVTLTETGWIILTIVIIGIIMCILTYCLSFGYMPIIDDIDNFIIWLKERKKKK